MGDRRGASHQADVFVEICRRYSLSIILVRDFDQSGLAIYMDHLAADYSSSSLHVCNSKFSYTLPLVSKANS